MDRRLRGACALSDSPPCLLLGVHPIAPQLTRVCPSSVLPSAARGCPAAEPPLRAAQRPRGTPVGRQPRSARPSPLWRSQPPRSDRCNRARYSPPRCTRSRAHHRTHPRVRHGVTGRGRRRGLRHERRRVNEVGRHHDPRDHPEDERDQRHCKYRAALGCQSCSRVATTIGPIGPPGRYGVITSVIEAESASDGVPAFAAVWMTTVVRGVPVTAVRSSKLDTGAPFHVSRPPSRTRAASIVSSGSAGFRRRSSRACSAAVSSCGGG